MIDLFRKAAKPPPLPSPSVHYCSSNQRAVPIISACAQRGHFAETENTSKTCRARCHSHSVCDRVNVWLGYICTYVRTWQSLRVPHCVSTLYPPVVSRRRTRDWPTKAFTRGRRTGPKTVEIARDVTVNSPLWPMSNVAWCKGRPSSCRFNEYTWGALR